MLKKIKFLLICTVIAVGVSSCSKSDNSNPGGSGDEKYILSVIVTEGATIEQVVAVLGDATGSMDTDVVRDIPGTTWSKEYTKKSGQKISFTVHGFGKDDGSSKMTVKLTKDNKVVKEASGSGVVLQAMILI